MFPKFKVRLNFWKFLQVYFGIFPKFFGFITAMISSAMLKLNSEIKLSIS